MISTLFGMGLGVSVQLMLNTLNRQRYLASKFSAFYFFNLVVTLTKSLGPWFLVIYGGAGAYLGYNYNRWELELLATVNEKRRKFGLPEIERAHVLVPKQDDSLETKK